MEFKTKAESDTAKINLIKEEISFAKKMEEHCNNGENFFIKCKEYNEKHELTNINICVNVTKESSNCYNFKFYTRTNNNKSNYLINSFAKLTIKKIDDLAVVKNYKIKEDFLVEEEEHAMFSFLNDFLSEFNFNSLAVGFCKTKNVINNYKINKSIKNLKTSGFEEFKIADLIDNKNLYNVCKNNSVVMVKTLEHKNYKCYEQNSNLITRYKKVVENIKNNEDYYGTLYELRTL